MRLPLADVAAATGVPLRTLRRWAADGRVTVECRLTRAGDVRAWLVDPLEVDELAEVRERRGRLTGAG